MLREERNEVVERPVDCETPSPATEGDGGIALEDGEGDRVLLEGLGED